MPWRKFSYTREQLDRACPALREGTPACLQAGVAIKKQIVIGSNDHSTARILNRGG